MKSIQLIIVHIFSRNRGAIVLLLHDIAQINYKLQATCSHFALKSFKGAIPRMCLKDPIFNEAKVQGLPEPQIIEIGMRMRVIIRLSQPIGTQQMQEKIIISDERLESRLESKLAAKILLHIKKEEVGKLHLAEHLGHKSVSGELHKQIKRLLALDMIEMTIPEKPNSRLQKYRLTAIGSNLIDME